MTSTAKLALLLTMIVTDTPASTEDVATSALATSCAGCHGGDGRGGQTLPSLAGRPVDDLNQSLQDFKHDKSTGTVMNRIAKGFTYDEIYRLAGYFSRLP